MNSLAAFCLKPGAAGLCCSCAFSCSSATRSPRTEPAKNSRPASPPATAFGHSTTRNPSKSGEVAPPTGFVSIARSAPLATPHSHAAPTLQKSRIYPHFCISPIAPQVLKSHQASFSTWAPGSNHMRKLILSMFALSFICLASTSSSRADTIFTNLGPGQSFNSTSGGWVIGPCCSDGPGQSSPSPSSPPKPPPSPTPSSRCNEPQALARSTSYRDQLQRRARRHSRLAEANHGTLQAHRLSTSPAPPATCSTPEPRTSSSSREPSSRRRLLGVQQQRHRHRVLQRERQHHRPVDAEHPPCLRL